LDRHWLVGEDGGFLFLDALANGGQFLRQGEQLLSLGAALDRIPLSFPPERRELFLGVALRGGSRIALGDYRLKLPAQFGQLFAGLDLSGTIAT
jgi:hypothetical protein